MNASDALYRPASWWQRKRWWLLVLVVVSALGFGVVTKLQNKQHETQAQESAAKDKAPTQLEFTMDDMAVVTVQALSHSVAVSGSLMPLVQTTVKSTVAGGIGRVHVREGETVRQGMVLVEMEATDARTRLEAALADQAERRARLDLAKRNLDSNLGLLKQNFISQNAYDQLQSTYQATLAAVQWADAQVKLARKAIEDAQVHAPMAGVVAKRLVNPGERVLPDAPLLQLVDLSRMELEAALPARDITGVEVGQAVRFTVDGFADKAFDGRVQRINPVAEPGSRAIKLFVEVPNPKGVLRGGMFAQGRLNLAASTNVPVIPLSAVFEEAAQTYVFAVLAGKLVKQAVGLGQRDEASGHVEVTRGLEPGQQVVRVRMTGLKAGQAVVMANAPTKSASASN